VRWTTVTKVLITGMSGTIGGLLRDHLERVGGYELSALNRRRVEGVASFQADIADLEAIRPAFVGQDVVVHLAAQVRDEPFEALVAANLVGTYNVFESARQAGVKRVIFASSGATIKGWEDVPPYDAIGQLRYEDVPESWAMITHDMVRPRGTYGASKVWGEALGRHFSDAFGLSVLCVRIGAVGESVDSKPAETSANFLSHRDVADILHRCINAPADLKYDIFFATSRNRYGYRDLSHPRDVLGFVPQDTSDRELES
jgi:nucleoside-diphosphate-sugar epimerase